MRISRSVLREAGGEIPPAYSPKFSAESVVVNRYMGSKSGQIPDIHHGYLNARELGGGGLKERGCF